MFYLLIYEFNFICLSVLNRFNFLMHKLLMFLNILIFFIVKQLFKFVDFKLVIFILITVVHFLINSLELIGFDECNHLFNILIILVLIYLIYLIFFCCFGSNSFEVELVPFRRHTIINFKQFEFL